MSLLDYLKSVLKSGIENNQSFVEKKEIIFINKVILSLSLIGFVITIIELIFGFTNQALLSFFIFSFVLFAIPAQRMGRMTLAKSITWGVPALATTVCVILYGTNGNAHFYFIALLAISLIFFKSNWVKLALFIFHAGIFTFMESSRGEYQPIIDAGPSEVMNLANIFIMLFAIWLLLFEFRNHEQQYEGKINHLMVSLKSQSELLYYQKQQIQQQAEELQNANLILKKEVIEKEEVRQQLLASNQDLKQYASIVSHDLKEPLRTVGSFTQLLLRRHENNFDGPSKDYANFIVDAVSRMSRLLDDLLSFTRLNRKMEVEETDLNQILELVKHNLRHQFETTSGAIYSPNLPTLSVNKQQFIQVFQNLISNGLKFRRDDINPIIKIEYYETEQRHQFFFHDNGIGIPHEYQEKIFSLFQRLHARDAYEGSGVGLSICRRVLQNHGGEIWLEPVHGIGTVIGFSIPKKEANELREESSNMLAMI